MRTLRLSLLSMVPFFFFTPQAGAIADGQLRGDRALNVREVCKFTSKEHPYLNGSLTFDGKHLIIVEPRKKLSLYNVKDLKETVISENPLLVGARSDSATGGVFVTLESEKIGNKDDGKQYLKFLDLLYFEKTSDLLNWKPRWTKSRLAINTEKGGKEIHAQWIPGVQQFALYRISASNEFSFVDSDGKDVGKLKLPGSLFGGFDSSDDGVEAYFIVNDKQGAFIVRGVLSSAQDKLVGSGRLYSFPNRVPYSYDFKSGRQLRLRGLRSGDVRRFVELVNQPAHGLHKDHENIGLEAAQLHSLKLMTFNNYYRIGELGMLSYAESPKEFEVVLGHHSTLYPNMLFPSFVYRRDGDRIMLPLGTRERGHDPYSVVDAVLSDETWVVSMRESVQVGRSETESRFYVCTLDNSH